MFEYGLIFGIMPGATMLLLIQTVMNKNLKSALLVAVSPIIADIPIVTTLIIGINIGVDLHIENSEKFLQLLSVFTMLYFAFKALHNKPVKEHIIKTSSLIDGIVINLSNPAPYIFWFSIGLLTIGGKSITCQIGQILSFYLGLIGVKIIIAYVVSFGKNRLIKYLDVLNKIVFICFVCLSIVFIYRFIIS